MKLKKYLFLSTILIICACSTNLISSSNSTSKISDNISSEEIVSSSNNSIINSVSTSYNDIGDLESLDNIIEYCKNNWDSNIWSYKKSLPLF